MSELRDRIAEALYENSVRELGFELPDHKGRTAVPWDRLPEGAKESWCPRVDAILAIPGIAVVELPEPDQSPPAPYWDGGWIRTDRRLVVLGEQQITVSSARVIAAALLAAAEYAEREQ